MSSITAADILSPKKKASKKQRNYQSDYKRQLKVMQMENRVISEHDKYEKSRKPFQLKQFENVPSRVSPNKSSPTKKLNSPEKSPLKTPKRKKSMSPRSTQSVSSSINYVEQNRLEAGNSTIHVKPATLDKVKTKKTPNKHKNFGKTPKYILERESQREAERLAREEEAKNSMPPGMRQMGEDERLETLNLLNKRQREIAQRLAKLPLIIESPSLRRRQQALEEEQDEVENAIETFSQEVIYVKE